MQRVEDDSWKLELGATITNEDEQHSLKQQEQQSRITNSKGEQQEHCTNEEQHCTNEEQQENEKNESKIEIITPLSRRVNKILILQVVITICQYCHQQHT